MIEISSCQYAIVMALAVSFCGCWRELSRVSVHHPMVSARRGNTLYWAFIGLLSNCVEQACSTCVSFGFFAELTIGVPEPH